MMRYYFNRNGAIVCGRDTLQECLDYAKRQMGWDLHLGADTYRDAFGGSHSTTYKVEEHELLTPEHPDYQRNCWKRTYNDTVLNTSQAVLPFPTRKESRS